MDLTLFGLSPNKFKTIWQKNLKKNQVLPRGSSDYFNKFTQSCKTYHFIVKSIFKNFSGWTRSHDAYARFSPIYEYNIVFSLYRVCLHPLLPLPPIKGKFFVGPQMSRLIYHNPPPPPPRGKPDTDRCCQSLHGRLYLWGRIMLMMLYIH
jgi:hypothetical protein